MLIGIDASRAVSRRRTGTEAYSLHLIRELLRLNSGHRFRLYTNGQPPEGHFWPDRAPSGAEVKAMAFPRMWTHLRLSAEMVVASPDVLFVPAHVLPLIHPRACVVTVHDLGYLRFPRAHGRWARRYLDWSTRWNAQRAALVVADSAATKADLVNAYGTRPERVHVVHLGRDESLSRAEDLGLVSDVLARYGLTSPYLLYVGTLQPRKNLARVVQAFARVCEEPAFRDMRLVLAGGQGWMFGELVQCVARHGLEHRVSFPGYVSEGDLAPLFSGALGFVFPSLYEGFGLPVLEAGACGVPVITSKTSSLPEVAGDAALYVDPLDVDAIAAAMYRLVTDPALREELARRGRENARRFTWEKCARETLAVLESAAESGPHRRIHR